MDDKAFELLSKMYSEMQTGFAKMDERLTGVENHVVRLEDKIDTNSKALFDGYKQTYEKLEVLEKKVDEISSKVQKQDVEIRVIKNAATS